MPRKTGTLVGLSTPKTELTVTKTPSKLNRPTGYAAQVTRAFKDGTAKHIADGLYKIKLAKQGENVTVQTIIEQLESLKLTNIQYVTQNNYYIEFLTTATPTVIKKLQKA